MVLYICLFQNIMFAFMPEDDLGIKLKASKKLKKIEMFFLTLCLLFIILRKALGVLQNSISNFFEKKKKSKTFEKKIETFEKTFEKKIETFEKT